MLTMLARRASRWTIALAVPVLALNVLAAAASDDGEERRVIDDDWVIAVGGQLADFKTDASVGSASGLGSLIRIEDDLGLNSDESLVRLDGLARLTKRQAIGFGFWTLNREGQIAIAEQIEFDGNVFDVGVNIDTHFDTGWTRVDWRYSLLKTERGEAGLSAGLSIYRFEAGVAGLATVDDGMGGTLTAFAQAEDDFLAPVPTLGIFLNHAFRRNLVMRVKADLMNIDIGDISGELTDVTFLLEWYFSRHVGFGLGGNRFEIDVRNTGSDPYLVDFSQSGVLGYFTFAF